MEHTAGCTLREVRHSNFFLITFQLSVRTDKLSWRHHYEVASLKTIAEATVQNAKRSPISFLDVVELAPASKSLAGLYRYAVWACEPGEHRG